MSNHLEKLRKQGNFTPQKSFMEDSSLENEKNVYKKTDNSKDSIDTENEKYIPGKNQRKTLKVSPQTKLEIEELKRELRMGFNYEVIQYLIDNYVHEHLNPRQQQRFHENTKL